MHIGGERHGKEIKKNLDPIKFSPFRPLTIRTVLLFIIAIQKIK